jgi:hypothetical protein
MESYSYTHRFINGPHTPPSFLLVWLASPVKQVTVVNFDVDQVDAPGPVGIAGSTHMTDIEVQVQAVVDGLNYDFNQFTVPHFIDHLETLRARDIILQGVSFDQGLHGFWIRAETADYVFFNRRTHEVHQIHHILHELGHMMLKHQLHDLALLLPPKLVARLRSLTPALQGHCRSWNPNDIPEEREAELFVRRLQHEILLARRLAALTHPVTSISALSRFTRGLGYAD